jgi:actin-related protein 5
MEGRLEAKNALITAFVRGGSSEKYDPLNLDQGCQLHLNVERIRVPETWFQPSMFGLDSAGLGEVAGWVLNGFEEEQRKKMMQVSGLLIPTRSIAVLTVQCIYVTGGCAVIPGLVPRMRNTLTPLLPFKAPLKIVTCVDGDPRLDAWRGMAAWSTSQEAKSARVTRAEYEEYGGEWLKEHRWGNLAP